MEKSLAGMLSKGKVALLAGVAMVALTRDLAGNRLDQSPGVAGSQPKVWVFTTMS